MNLCAMCQYKDSKMSDGRYMYAGMSLCRRHLILAMTPAEVPSDASHPPLKWEKTEEK